MLIIVRQGGLFTLQPDFRTIFCGMVVLYKYYFSKILVTNDQELKRYRVKNSVNCMINCIREEKLHIDGFEFESIRYNFLILFFIFYFFTR